MPRFAANLSLLYPEHRFLDRFEAAAADGFEAVEMAFPYEVRATSVKTRLDRHHLRAVLINAPPGKLAAGERGLACLTGREAEFRASIEQALAFAREIACPRVHVLSGRLPTGLPRADRKSLWVGNLRWAAAAAAAAGLRLCIEPVNPRDLPAYYLSHQAQALDLIAAVGAPQLGLLMNWYHCQITEGDVATRLRQAIAAGVLEHVQIAGVPDGHEPDSGELRIEFLLDLLDQLGYDGHVGCAYRPRAGTSEGLGWLRRARRE